MKLIVVKDYEAMSRKGADIISALLTLKSDAVLGLATGSTPVGMYKELAKRNEKAAYQYVEKIAWKLEDIKTHITNLMNGAVESGLMELYNNEECINGKGKRLGLQTLAGKTFKAISQLEDAIGTLKKIADDGTDPFSVGDHMSARTRARCWA